MTLTYSRSPLLVFTQLSEKQQAEIRKNYFAEDSDCYSTQYAILKGYKEQTIPLPVSMFEPTENNHFTHAILMNGIFMGYYITFAKNWQECIIAKKFISTSIINNLMIQ